MMKNVLVITSGKGGVGKTTSTANIGMALAEMGKKVLLIDTDIGLRNLDVALGLENRIVYDLIDVIKGSCRLKQALIEDKRNPDLCLLPAAQMADKDAVNTDEMLQLIAEALADFDYVLIDCPAGIERGFLNAACGAGIAVIVAVPELSSLRDADRISALLMEMGITERYLLINRYRRDLAKKGELISAKDMQEMLQVPLLGIIPEDDMILRLSNFGEMAVHEKRSRAGAAFLRAAERIIDGSELLLRKHGLFTSLFHKGGVA